MGWVARPAPQEELQDGLFPPEQVDSARVFFACNPFFEV